MASAAIRGLVTATLATAVLGLSAVAAVPAAASQADQPEAQLILVGNAQPNTSVLPAASKPKKPKKSDKKSDNECDNASSRGCNLLEAQPRSAPR